MSTYLRTPSDTTPALLAAAHRGEERAQRTLYEHFYAYARTVALHYGDTEADAEDIVQDAFIKLLRDLRERPFDGDFTAYFRRILVNTGIDHYRARRRRLRLFDRLREWPVGSTANEGEYALSDQDVYHFLQRLSPVYRLVFNLYVIEGYTHEEVARQLGISVGTSKSNLHKARRRLQQLAGPYFQSDNPLHHG